VSPTKATPAVPRTDGRTARAHRNQAKLVDAVHGLLREGETIPTREQVAARAGLSLRTAYRHFADIESLTAAISARLGEEVLPWLSLGPFLGDTPTRVRELVRRRSAMYELMAPFRRATEPWVARLPGQVGDRKMFAEVTRHQMRDALGAELENRDDDFIELLDAAISFETWDRMRREQQLDAERAARLLERAIHALLAEPPSDDPRRTTR